MADPDGIQMTEFGGPSEEPRYMDSKSAQGIGFREGYTMQKDVDVALNSQARAKFNIQPYDPSKPETADQWFTYGGKKYHYADNVPEIYDNARIDVFKGPYDISKRGQNVIGWKPGNIDINHNSTSLLTRFREQHPESLPISNETILAGLKEKIAPGMDPQQWHAAATSPNGGVDVMAYFNTPLVKLRQSAGELGKDKSDEQLLRGAYDYNVANGKINKDTESFDDFKERFVPDNSWQAQTRRTLKLVADTVIEAGSRVPLKLEELGLNLYGGVKEMEVDAAHGDIRSVLSTIYPDQDNKARLQEYAKMSIPDAEAKLRQDIEQGGADLQNRLVTQGISPDRLFDRMDAGLRELKSKQANQDLADWANKVVLKAEKDNPGHLPENQEKIANTLAELPGMLIMNAIPGLREGGNYDLLRKQNREQIKRDHPDWDEETVSARVERASDEQFIGQEIASLLMMRGLPPNIRAGVTGMLWNATKSLGISTTAGALTMSANQVIANIEDDKPPMTGVSDAFTSGAIMGGVGHGIVLGSQLSVLGLKRAFMATPQIRKAMGVGEGVLTQSADGTMRMLNGNGDSPVEKKLETNAIDMSLNGVKAAVEVEKEQESPVVEAFRKAEAARESGDTGEAQKQIDQALALATPTQRDIINRHVAAQLRAVTNTPPPTIAKPKEPTAPTAVPIEWITLPPYQHKSELPEGAQTRVNPVTGETEYRLPGPVKTPTSDQPVIDYYGTDKAPKAEEKIKPPLLEQKEHSFPSGHIQTRPDGQADLYMENGVKLTFPDVGDAIAARGTIRSARGHKWQARSSGETISHAELNNGQEVETAVPPKTGVTKPVDRPHQIYEPVGLKEVQERYSAARKQAYEALSPEDRARVDSRSPTAISKLEAATDALLAQQEEEEAAKPEIATEPVTTYQPELNAQGQPTGRQIAFRGGQRIGVVNPKAPGQTVDPATPAPTTKLEDQLQKSIDQRAQRAKGVAGWNIGDTVNVGFMRGLKVLRRIPTPGDYAPDQWLLQNDKGAFYLFTPHKGIQKVEDGMEGLGAFFNPFAAMREAKRWAGQNPLWQTAERFTRKTLAPQRLSEEASDVAAMGIPLQTGAKTNLINRIYQLAIHNNLNGVFNRAAESERREAFFNGKTDAQLRQWVTDWATKKTTGNTTVDKLLAFNNEVTKFYTDMATKSKVTNSFLARLFKRAFKNQDAAAAWYNEQIETTKRVPNFQEAIAAGLELRTYNPERLMLAHAATVMEGLKEIDMLEQMVEEGYAALKEPAVETGAKRGGTLSDPDLFGVREVEGGKPIHVPAKVPYGWTGSFLAADGHTYVMSPEAEAVVKNMFGPSRMYDSIDMLPGHFFNAVKGTIGAKLSWSQFHQTHIGTGIVPADVMTEYMARLGKGLVKPGETVKALGGTIEGYLSIPVSTARMVAGLTSRIPFIPISAKYLDPFFERMIPTARKFHALVDVMQGTGGYDKLTQSDKTNYKDLLGMGIVARPTHERYLQWVGWLAKQGTIGKVVGAPVRWGYNVLTNPEFQHWYFGRVLPSLKIASALRKRDTIFRYYDKEGINLRDPANAQTLRGEFAKINRDVEGRFGEMLYDNLLWSQTAKAVGTQTQLSLGWGLGFWRMHGDAVQDLTDNALNMDRIANGTYKNAELVTNRMLFALNYWGATIAAGLTTSVVLGGVAPNALKFIDGVFPQIGKDKDGNPMRIRPPFWSSEMLSLYENAAKDAGGNLFSFEVGAGLADETGRYLFNRLSPALHTFYQMAIDRDWRNRLIADPNDGGFWGGLRDWVGYGVKDLLTPIGVETAFSGRAKETRAKIAALLGFGPAPAWVNRSAFENLVIAKADQRKPFGVIGHREALYYDLRTDYMLALQSKDPRAIDEALKNWKAIDPEGASDKQVKNAQNEVLKRGHGRINTALNRWKNLDEDTQFHLLEVAPKEFFLDFFNEALPQARAKWQRIHGPLTPDQLAQTVPAQ